MAQNLFSIIFITLLFISGLQQTQAQQKAIPNRNGQKNAQIRKQLTAEDIAKIYLSGVALIICDDG